MASTKTISCKFFPQGLCRNGESCKFNHERNTGTQNLVQHSPPFGATDRLGLNPTVAIATPIDHKGKANYTPICTFFVRGLCTKGNQCWYRHPSDPDGPVLPRLVNPDAITHDTGLSQQCESESYPHPHPHAIPDSRATVPCKFLSRSGGCRNSSCPYLHTLDGDEVEQASSGNQHVEVTEDEDQERKDNFTRDLSGALVSFDHVGQIVKVSLPTDFSIACITGLAQETTPQMVVEILRGLDFNVNVDFVRILGHTASEGTKATVKAEDPLFANNLSARLEKLMPALSAVSIPIDSRRSNCRKVYISWHKTSRSVWMNFGNAEIANRVAQKFLEGRYKCLGQSVKCSVAVGPRTAYSSGRRRFSHNPVAYTITLSDVPGHATRDDVEKAIKAIHDKPRHIEMGDVSYSTSDAEVSVEVRSRLEDHGQLESFYLAPESASKGKGKRVKAAAWFREEADARSACSLNSKRLDIIGGGKLTVTLVQSAKVKVQTTIYLASKSRIDQEKKIWQERHLAFHVYSNPSQGYTMLKVEGDNATEVARARKTLDEISSGIVLTEGEREDAVWTSALHNNGSAYQKLKMIEKKLDIVIHRDKSRRQLRFHGPREKFQQAVGQVTEMLKEEERSRSPTSGLYEMVLNDDQFSWMIHDGFKNIERVLGKNVAIFNVVTRSLAVSGTRQQYETALAMMNGNLNKKDSDGDGDGDALDLQSISLSVSGPVPEGDCPICFCEADNPIQTSCKHTYCLECFEDCCKSAASTSKDKNGFQVKCQGDEGTCPTIFTLRELQDHLPSSVFETVLQSSFEEYIQRHPEAFHYCPTPDCGYVYRCSGPDTSNITTSNTTAIAASSSTQNQNQSQNQSQKHNQTQKPYSCPSCFEPICTSCHARHGNYTCAEYKDIASGGYEALQRLKRELNIKDCPKCTTPMEKTEGCNHMTCGGCKAHICWVCLAVFDQSGPCYDHMNKEHGGIGLGLGRLAW
ncbi:hypothetical protein A1O3_00446 [Capronia epimyces CBS 606.96]|uniref:Uncharacterized protein n=1 Tax=Capronia epimyces CBS 606.96 TaxID=1182542 RepID=W9YRN7_9EURO|nr:uncharacterized protein A1O3_00446 [Capronia epimyces CBS 606.96]EXJ91896.1 hypothetical protein A1O3_00446 [Capronia epimyces CBS 606.96]